MGLYVFIRQGMFGVFLVDNIFLPDRFYFKQDRLLPNFLSIFLESI